MTPEEYERERAAFRRRWGYDPDPVVREMLDSGGFTLVGGTPEERAFIRDALPGPGAGGHGSVHPGRAHGPA